MTRGILLKYNKVHNDSLHSLAPKLEKHFEVLWGDLSVFGEKMDLLTYDVVKDYFAPLGKLEFIVVGDVFWNTGQAICHFGHEHDVSVFFLQHGQWIYIKNKKELNHYPTYTFLFGDNVSKMCSSWIYGENSQIVATGSPRYDNASSNGGNSYVYFSPPVIEEIIHGQPTEVIRHPFRENLEAIRNIDKELPMIIHPHYREARIDYLHQLFPRAQFADPQLDALKLIRGAAKVLASRNSTIVLDAIAHQKPVVLMDFPEIDVCFFKRGYFDGFATESANSKNVVENLKRDIKIKSINYVQKAREHICLGNASARIVEQIKNAIAV